MKLFASCAKLFDNSMSLTTTLTILKNNPLKFPHWIVIVLLLLIIKEQERETKRERICTKSIHMIYDIPNFLTWVS